MKKKVIIFILLIIPIVVFAQTKQNSNQSQKERVVLVTVEKVTEGMTSPTMMITGSAYFSESSQVAAESAGKVLKVYVQEGDAVEIGQPLASLDDTLLSFSVESAKSATSQAKANLDKAKRDYTRSKNLYAQKSIAQQAYQDALTTYTNAQASYNSALASQKQLEVEKEKMLIKSPLKGVVISKDVEVGEWVTTGGQVAGVATLTYEAKVYIPESVLAYVKAGQQVVVRTSRKEYTGKVLSINSKGDPATRLFLTRIDLGQDPDLKEGILTTALIPSGAKVNSLLIPRDALVERNNVKGVFKVVEDNRVRFVPVKVIGYNGGYLAVSSITEGTLKKDDSVVLDGNNVVNNGVKIKIKAPAMDGKANAELIKFLAGFFGVLKGDIEIICGETSRDKLVRVNNASNCIEKLLNPPPKS